MSLLTCNGFAKHSQNLESKVNGLMDFKSKFTCKLPLYLQLLKTSKDCEYYTGVTNLSLFQNLHYFIVPFIRRRWRGVSLTSKKSMFNMM